MSSVLVAMSGGVDSSVAAAMLKEQGHDVVGVTFKNFDRNDLPGEPSPKNCCSLESLNNARQTCMTFGIPHYVLNRVEQFERQVLDDFRSTYLSGLTPNPCIRCNGFVRWPELNRLARELGLDFIATGHYARVVKKDDRILIGRAIDITKDQSYALWAIKPDYLEKTLLPIGDYAKNRIREIAAAYNLTNAAYPESQDICFVPEGDYADLVGQSAPGPIVDSSDRVIGEHRGLARYTIGQRRGLGISHPTPLYVIKLDINENKLVVGPEEAIFRSAFTISQANWFIDIRPGVKMRCAAKIRYRHEAAPCAIQIQKDDRARIVFDQPQRAITPGQSAVFYDNEIMIGGGVIDSVIRPNEDLDIRVDK